MTTVTVSGKNQTHMVKLSAGGTDIGLRPINGAAGIREIPFTPSSLKVTEGGGKYSDFDLPYSHIAQLDWSGGRGQLEFSDSTRFYDSYCAWTTREGMAVPGPQWSFASGNKLCDMSLWNGANMNWLALYGTNRFQSYYKSTSGDTYTGAKMGFWIKKVGSPGTLTAALYSDAGTPGTPNAAIASGTVTTSTITDIASLWYKFAVAASVTGATLYWVVIYGAATDDITNHWEVGGLTVSANAAYKLSADGTSWTNGTHKLYFVYGPADTQSTWGFYRHKEASYAYLNPAGDAAPTLYCIGDRGVADASASTTIVDATKSWTASRYIGSTALIFNGTGKGQYRTITANDTTSVTVDPAWGVTPDNTSEYVILGDWHLTTTSIGTHGLAKPITGVADCGSTVYFAMGDKQKISQNNVSQAANAFSSAWVAASDNVYADKICAQTDPSGGSKLWRVIATGDTVALSNAAVKLTAVAVSDFTAAGYLEPYEKPTNLLVYDGKVWAMTHKNVYWVINNLVTKLGIGLEAIPDWDNGVGAASQNLFLYFSWSHSMERFYGSTTDDMGTWNDAGLPSGRTGSQVCILPIVGWLISAIDAGPSGTSSVVVWNGRGWHEIFRAWETGKQIRSMYWEPIMGSRGRLWVGVGDDLIYMDFPLDTLNPINDSSFKYNHEGHVITSWLDAGYAELNKYYKEMSIRADNLSANTTVALDYQTDSDGDTSSWTNAGTADASPQENVSVSVGEKKRIRFRFRMLTSVHTTPPKLVASVLKAFARTQVKYQFNITFDVRHNGRTYNGLPDHNPDTLLNQLETWAEATTPVTMRCVLSRMDNKVVIVEPPGIVRSTWNRVQAWWTGVADIVLREA
ncbi:MAG: hypothetical protein WC935_00220 [Thermoleophilia bacterium]